MSLSCILTCNNRIFYHIFVYFLSYNYGELIVEVGSLIINTTVVF